MAGLTKEQKAAKVLLAKVLELVGVTAEEFAALPAEEQAAANAKAQAALDAEAAEAAEAKRIAEEQAAANAKELEVDNSHLIAVEKDGETLHVHPTALADHKRISWKEA